MKPKTHTYRLKADSKPVQGQTLHSPPKQLNITVRFASWTGQHDGEGYPLLLATDGKQYSSTWFFAAELFESNE